MYLLDSSAHPSIVSHQLQHESQLTKSTNTQTESSSLKTRHKGLLSIHLNNGTTLRIPALRNTQISANLVSVRDIAKNSGSVPNWV